MTARERDRLRAFLAIEIPEGPRAGVVDLMRRLRAHVDEGIRWVREDSLHLTFRFLGGTDAATLERLQAPLAGAARACPPFRLRVRGVGTFPEHGPPRVLWAGLEVPPEVYRLQEACERIAVAAGFAPETRPFKAHLTLGRAKDGARRPTLPADVDLGSGRVDRLVLFRSDLRPSGALHTPLAMFPFG